MTRFTSAVLIVASLGSGACSSHASTDPVADASVTTTSTAVVLPASSPMLEQIRRAPVAVRELPTDEIVAPGKIEANPNRVSKVVLPVAGRVTAVHVKTGDAVGKDQPLVTIQSPDADAAMSSYLSARATESQSGVALSKAQADLDREADLFEHDAVARKDVQSAESALAAAQASVEQARATREQSRRRLIVLGLSPTGFEQQVVVRSPLAGKVLELGVVPGEFRNDTTAPLMTIADLATVWVTSQVPESYIRFVQVGERVAINLVAYPSEVFEGRVSRVADTVDPQTRTVKVQAELDNPKGRFRPEMFGSIHHIDGTAKTLVVPAAAVIRNGGDAAVFVETAPGRFESTKVALGAPAGDLVRVVSGLAAGDSVVVDGAVLLQGLLKPASR